MHIGCSGCSFQSWKGGWCKGAEDSDCSHTSPSSSGCTGGRTEGPASLCSGGHCPPVRAQPQQCCRWDEDRNIPFRILREITTRSTEGLKISVSRWPLLPWRVKAKAGMFMAPVPLMVTAAGLSPSALHQHGFDGGISRCKVNGKKSTQNEQK